MQSRLWNNVKNQKNLYFKWGGVFCLFLFSVLIGACGNNSQADPGNPPVTVTINLNQINGSPTPPLPGYSCGGWVTNTTPPYNPSSIVNVFGKFVHNVNGNPEGIGGAAATATVLWPDGSVDTQTAQTTSDGLAVFPVTMKVGALGHVVLIQITFTSPQGKSCTIPQAAYFTPIMATATASPTASPGSGTALPTGTPKPRRTPGPGH